MQHADEKQVAYNMLMMPGRSVGFEPALLHRMVLEAARSAGVIESDSMSDDELRRWAATRAATHPRSGEHARARGSDVPSVIWPTTLAFETTDHGSIVARRRKLGFEVDQGYICPLSLNIV